MLRASLLMYLFTVFSVAAPILGLKAATSSISPGQIVTVDVQAIDIFDLYAFQFDIAFDPAVLEFIGVTEGSIFDGLESVFLPGIESSDGVVEITAGTLVGPSPGVSIDGVLARIMLRGISPGTAEISLTQGTLLDSTLFPIDAAFGSVPIEVGQVAVPEPSIQILGFLSLLGIILIARRGCPEARSVS